ncbi:ATP:Cob(I)alamin adenosyltransferase [Klebsiella michiganensis]|uniref:ATP:Cob(I)alamin adenosyltransferase n=1 Tax=Klebsiella michiganensis TaxID=1134687 RepID=A0A7H4MU86_9ENTR|nr:ATP:Cob(I)alamin adenosyltransferase [Klebsiella michiganensis]
MKDFITEAWLRANHTLSEGAEIHLPADARLTPSARELLESRRLRIKFLDEQGSLFVDDDAQQPQPVHGLTSSGTHPQACCELCRQPVDKKPDTLTHLTAEKMVAKSDPRLAFAPPSTPPSPWRYGCKSNWRSPGSPGWRISARAWAILCAPTPWVNRWRRSLSSG